MATPSGIGGFGVPIALHEQQKSQALADQEQQKQLQRNTIAGLYLNAVNTPLPKPDDPAYKEALQKREDLMKQYVASVGPEQHANFGQRLHGLIFGEPDAAQPVHGNAPEPPAPAATPSQPQPVQPTHPFAHDPVYAKIQEGLTGLGSHLKAFAHPLPPQAPPDYAALAAAPTPEERLTAEEERKEAAAIALQKQKGADELAAARARSAGSTTPEKAFLNQWATSHGKPDFGSLSTADQSTALQAYKKSTMNQTPKLEKINGNWYDLDPATGKRNLLASEADTRTTHGVRFITNQLTGEITEVPTTTVVYKATGQPIAGTTDNPGEVVDNPPVSTGAPSAPVSNKYPKMPGDGTSGPINPYKNPEDQPANVSFSFNKPWTKPDWKLTTLSPQDEREFQAWAAKNPTAVEGELNNPQADYDVRGHWLAAKNGDPSATLILNKWDGKMHGSDKFKTPYNGTFSNESMYATPDAPRWKGDKLITKDGRLVADETPLAHANAQIANGNAISKKLTKKQHPPKSSNSPQFTGGKVVGHTASLLNKSAAAQYTKAAEDANSKQEAYQSAVRALQHPTASSDQELIFAWVRSNVQGAGRMTQAEYQQARGIGSWPLRIQSAYERAKTGKLPPEIEQELLADIKRSAETAQSTASTLRSQAGGQPQSSQAPQIPSGQKVLVYNVKTGKLE